MPYLSQTDREKLDVELEQLLGRFGAFPKQDHPAVMNYIIMSAHQFLYMHGDMQKYADHNNFIGGLECAKLEIYRRHIAPYEDKKIEENGDVI